MKPIACACKTILEATKYQWIKFSFLPFCPENINGLGIGNGSYLKLQSSSSAHGRQLMKETCSITCEYTFTSMCRGVVVGVSRNPCMVRNKQA